MDACAGTLEELIVITPSGRRSYDAPYEYGTHRLFPLLVMGEQLIRFIGLVVIPPICVVESGNLSMSYHLSRIPGLTSPLSNNGGLLTGIPDSDRRRVLSVTKRTELPANERHHPDRPDPVN